MFNSPDRLSRLQQYCDELGKVCDQVNRELNQNRRKRSDWFQTTRKWKDEWLHPEDKNNPGNGKKVSGDRKE